MAKPRDVVVPLHLGRLLDPDVAVKGPRTVANVCAELARMHVLGDRHVAGWPLSEQAQRAMLLRELSAQFGGEVQTAQVWAVNRRTGERRLLADLDGGLPVGGSGGDK